jgi:tetratricopeptide (TPR) repeat protein
MVYLTRARVYAARGNFEEADKWLAKAGSTLQISDETLSEINLRRMFAAVKSSPENPDVRLSYARVLEGARRREEALVQVRKAAALDPAQPWAFLELGDLLWQLGQREEAVANFRHAVKLAPTNAEAMLALADAEKELGRYDQARELYAKVVEAQPLNLRARHHHALMLYATGDLEAAREELLRVVREAQAKGEVVDNGIPLPGPGILGSGIYFGPKRRLVAGFSMPEASADLAIAEALEDLEKHPRNGLLWQNIGNALLDLDLPALAVPALRRSREYDPSLLETRFLLAVAYRRTGDLMPAQEELKAVIAANPLHPRARLELAQLYTDDGELDKAQAEILAHSKNYPYERPARATRSLGG